MKFVVAVGMIAFGYAVLYYGVCLYRRYDPKAGTTDGVPPLWYLMGFPYDKEAMRVSETRAKASPKPPFQPAR